MDARTMNKQVIGADIKRLSDVASIKQLPTPANGNKVYYDDDVPGFGCRVTAAGAKAFVFNYRVRGTGRERRITIGRYPNWTEGAARTEARRLQQLVDQGGDPLGDIEDQRQAPTMAELIDRFVEEHLIRRRPGTVRAYKTLLDKHVRRHFGKHVKVADVAFTDIDALHRKITATGAPYAANRAMAVLSKMFSLAVSWNMRGDNPTKGIERNYEAKRKRYLDGPELGRLTKALAAHPDQQVANVIRVCLLTGCRIGEARSMRWADISQSTERGEDGSIVNKTTWSKPASMTKQKADHVVPLSAPAAQLLDEIRKQQTVRHKPLGTYVFPSSSSVTGHVISVEKSWRTICAAAAIKGLRVHDLRHSFASQLASGGASLPLIGALLGHASPATTARYAHLFDDPQRAAVEKVGAIVTAAGKPAEEPVPFPKGGRRGR